MRRWRRRRRALVLDQDQDQGLRGTGRAAATHARRLRARARRARMRGRRCSGLEVRWLRLFTTILPSCFPFSLSAIHLPIHSFIIFFLSILIPQTRSPSTRPGLRMRLYNMCQCISIHNHVRVLFLSPSPLPFYLFFSNVIYSSYLF